MCFEIHPYKDFGHWPPTSRVIGDFMAQVRVPDFLRSMISMSKSLNLETHDPVSPKRGIRQESYIYIIYLGI